MARHDRVAVPLPPPGEVNYQHAFNQLHALIEARHRDISICDNCTWPEEGKCVTWARCVGCKGRFCHACMERAWTHWDLASRHDVVMFAYFCVSCDTRVAQ